MNRKEFEIFEKWRKGKYEIDLEKLQNDLASRGLSRSGIREKEELWLREEYESEVARKKAEAEDYEEEKEKQERGRRNMIRTNRVLVSVAIISMVISAAGVMVGIYFSNKANLINEKQLLPQFEIIRKIDNLNTPEASESISIENKGAICYDPSFRLISFLRIDIAQNKLTKGFRIPLENYFAWRKLIDGKNDSVVFSYTAPLIDGVPLGETKYNYNELNNLNSKFSSLLYKNGRGLGSIFIEHYIKIDYQDSFERYHSDYYIVPIISGSIKMDKDSWEIMSKSYELKDHFSISVEPSAEWILNYVDGHDPDFTYNQ